MLSLLAPQLICLILSTNNLVSLAREKMLQKKCFIKSISFSYTIGSKVKENLLRLKTSI